MREIMPAREHRVRWWQNPDFPSERTTRMFIILGSVATVITLLVMMV
ncbi:hypothetical protein ABH926_003198 [Catenulispora sp. GP43]